MHAEIDLADLILFDRLFQREGLLPFRADDACAVGGGAVELVGHIGDDNILRQLYHQRSGRFEAGRSKGGVPGGMRREIARKVVTGGTPAAGAGDGSLAGAPKATRKNRPSCADACWHRPVEPQPAPASRMAATGFQKP